MAQFYAHSTEGAQEFWQPLNDHLMGVGDLAAEYGAPLGLREAARLAGLLHDLGKFDPVFQARLSGAKIPVDHSTAGAWHVRQMPGVDKFMAELIAHAVAGHHAGLPDSSGAPGALSERLAGFDPSRLDASLPQAFPLSVANLIPASLKQPKEFDRFGFRFAMLGRMLFSCLVDADYRDTEAFYNRIDGREADRTWPSLGALLPALRSRYDAHMTGISSASGDINTLRREILTHVRAGAAEVPGFFTLTVPTGGGKTLASLGFALDHAAQYGQQRIICAIPYTSIIDQTAAIFRDVLELGSGMVVLEHHSAVEPEEKRLQPEGREARGKLRLAMEDWAAPVIVTTNVQLFESLFAARPGRCRKLHNISKSVIILDEAQTLPRNLLIPAIWALRELVEVYGCTVVLCTATQPALEESRFPVAPNGRAHKLGLPLKGRELAPDPIKLAAKLKRVTIHHGGMMPDEALLEALAKQPQGLVIVNSRRHALELFRAGQRAGLDGMVHLTTRQYAAHRRVILKDVRARLENMQPCRLVATSLIEAGVDVDFAEVWRAESGLDQIIQAAGRCNREGRRAAADSLVTIFESPVHKPHGDLGPLAAAMNRVRQKHPDLPSLAAMEDYFHEVYWQKGEEGLDQGIDEKGAKLRITAQFQMTPNGVDLAYRKVASAFRMIEEGMVPVIIQRDETARKLVEKLGLAEISSGALARGLQTYIVQVTPKVRAELIENGHVQFAAPELRADQFAVLESDFLYKEDVGLEWERMDEVEEYIL